MEKSSRINLWPVVRRSCTAELPLQQNEARGHMLLKKWAALPVAPKGESLFFPPNYVTRRR